MIHTPLNIRHTPNCQPYPWHPSVVYVDEGWNGHKWWMAETPFPPMDVAPYRDRWELPCIHYSDDGKNWYPITSNPIDDIDETMLEAHNYLSDPHLLVKDGIMECWYRVSYLKEKKVYGNETVLVKKTSISGFEWSNREVIVDLRNEDNKKIWGGQIISPSIIWRNGLYMCWYVDRSSYMSNRKIRMTQSLNGKDWQISGECSLLGLAVDPWHIDVQYYDDRYQLLVYDYDSIYWYDSLDGKQFNFVSKVISPSNLIYDFSVEGLYRACSVKVENRIFVYYSAQRRQTCYIGLLTTTDRKLFEYVNGMSLCSYVNSDESILGCLWKSLKRKIKKCIRHAK